MCSVMYFCCVCYLLHRCYGMQDCVFAAGPITALWLALVIFAAGSGCGTTTGLHKLLLAGLDWAVLLMRTGVAFGCFVLTVSSTLAGTFFCLQAIALIILCIGIATLGSASLSFLVDHFDSDTQLFALATLGTVAGYLFRYCWVVAIICLSSLN